MRRGRFVPLHQLHHRVAPVPFVVLPLGRLPWVVDRVAARRKVKRVVAARLLVKPSPERTARLPVVVVVVAVRGSPQGPVALVHPSQDGL